MRVTIVDYANGNANAIVRALRAVGVEPTVSGESTDIVRSDFLVLPGVGHAGSALATLRAADLVQPLEDAVLARRIPVLGICLGMQIMVDYVAEGDCPGLGWIRGQAVPLAVADRRRYKVPHIGWSTVTAGPGSYLMPADSSDRDFYFCHKYAVIDVPDADSVSDFHYESRRTAVFEHRNLFGVQFHPEKSHGAGAALFRRFLSAR